MKKAIIIAMLALSFNNICAAKELHTIHHQVAANETLDSIAMQYITTDRYFPEFREGIVENNYDRIFVSRVVKEVQPGDELEINVWF